MLCSFDLIFSAFPVLHLFFTLHQLASTTASHGHCGFGRFGLCTYSTIGRRRRRVSAIRSSTCCCFFLSKTCMAHQFCCLGSLCNLFVLCLCCVSLFVASVLYGANRYDEDVSGWLPFKLKHQFQRNITCMEWQPLSGTGLAVGCQSGICFWRLTSPSDTSDQNNPKNQKNAWCEFFCADNQQHAPINALSWSPNGRLLASGSVSSDHILIWVRKHRCTPLMWFWRKCSKN